MKVHKFRIQIFNFTNNNKLREQVFNLHQLTNYFRFRIHDEHEGHIIKFFYNHITKNLPHNVNS